MKVTCTVSYDRFEVDLLTEEISGGGLKVIAPREVLLGNTVDVAVDLRDGKPPVHAGGTVLRSSPNDEGGFVTCVQFHDMGERDMDRLVELLTAEMRKAMNL